MTITQSRLIELQNNLKNSFRVRVPAYELTLIVDELIEKRDHPRYREIVELRADREDRADAWALFKESLDKPTDIEALAQRLAKVEDRLTALARASEDILKAVELLAEVAFDELAETPSTEAAFPTGAATTVEEVIAQAEEPSAESDDGPPRRGDRVRLEGARSTASGRRVADGWYDVIGATDMAFQIATSENVGHNNLATWLPWLGLTPAIKEVRRGAAKLPE